MNQLFSERCKLYFDEADRYLDLLNDKAKQGFFLNTKKAGADEILSVIDFDFEPSNLGKNSYIHQNDNIGKSKAYELGLIYPQESASSLFSDYIDYSRIKTVVDLCSAPGGKTINVLNNLPGDVLCIANDINHSRALVLSSNLERLGLDNIIITNKDTDVLAKQLEGFGDLVIVDAPCSGEGMIRKYPEILDTYSLDNINNLAQIQKNILEDAYRILKKDGVLVYSTCTYAFEEDEDQVSDFLKRYDDMELIPLTIDSYAKLANTVKLCPLNGSEGQFFAIMKKKSETEKTKIKYLKTIKNKYVEDFIKENLNIENYYLYEYNNHFYLSLIPLIDLHSQIIKYGIYLGDIVNNRFEANHNLYRANSLRNSFVYEYDLNDEEYLKYISGNIIKFDGENHQYLITYKKHSLGYGKGVNGTLKNKYPKGLRRMI